MSEFKKTAGDILEIIAILLLLPFMAIAWVLNKLFSLVRS